MPPIALTSYYHNGNVHVFLLVHYLLLRIPPCAELGDFTRQVILFPIDSLHPSAN